MDIQSTSTKYLLDQTTFSVYGVEEEMCSMRYGLKGRADLSMQATTSSFDKQTTTTMFPLEIKTGEYEDARAHRAQTILYTIMMSEHYREFVQNIAERVPRSHISLGQKPKYLQGSYIIPSPEHLFAFIRQRRTFVPSSSLGTASRHICDLYASQKKHRPRIPPDNPLSHDYFLLQ